MLNEITCPHCGTLELTTLEPTGLVVCGHCGRKYADDDPIACPNCEAINPATASYCNTCGEALKQQCGACGAQNWAGADTCIRCQQSLNRIEALTQRQAQGFRGTLEEQRRTAKSLKAKEAVASEKRLAGLWNQEQQRQDQLAQQQAQQKAQQSQLLLVAVIFLAIFVVVAVLVVIAMAR